MNDVIAAARCERLCIGGKHEPARVADTGWHSPAHFAFCQIPEANLCLVAPEQLLVVRRKGQSGCSTGRNLLNELASFEIPDVDPLAGIANRRDGVAIIGNREAVLSVFFFSRLDS